MENLHVRFEAEEAVNSKKALLSTEINLLNTIKKIQEYKNFRKQELSKKSSLRTKLKEVAREMQNLRLMLPKTKHPKIKEETTTGTKKMKLEDELKEIKERLKALS